MQVPSRALPAWTRSSKRASRETYLKGDPTVLHAEITRRDCDRKRAQLFFALSYAPRDGAEWQEMRRTRAGISCDKSKN